MNTAAQQQVQQDGQQENQRPQISPQIAVYKTSKKLIEMLDKLSPAQHTEYAHIHGSGDDGNGSRVYSIIGLVLLDYTNGTGDNTVRVTANLAPEDIAFLLDRIRLGFTVAHFSQEKIFGSVEGMENGGQVTKVFIKRNSADSNGNSLNYPWYIEVQNGTGIKDRTATGGTFIKVNSYQMVKKVRINLNDQDMYKLMHKVVRYIEVWEMTYGMMLLKRATQLRQNQG